MHDLEFNCPHCNKELACKPDQAGQIISCPECKGRIAIPATSPGSDVKVAVLRRGGEPEQDEEQEVLMFQPSMRAFIGQFFWGILLIPVLIGVIILIALWYKCASKRYRLTTQRLFVFSGLIAKNADEVELFRVKDVTVRQSFFQRLFGFGTIVVLSTDDTHPAFELVGVRDPIQVKETIRTHYRAARKREGVRSAEFIQS